MLVVDGGALMLAMAVRGAREHWHRGRSWFQFTKVKWCGTREGEDMFRKRKKKRKTIKIKGKKIVLRLDTGSGRRGQPALTSRPGQCQYIQFWGDIGSQLALDAS